MRWRFWEWLFIGIEKSKPGVLKLADRWLFVHCLIGLVLAYFSDLKIYEAASTFLLPLAGVFVGLSFAWAGNAQALLQDTHIEQLAQKNPEGIEGYIYTFQLAILVILITLGAWGIGALKIFDAPKLGSCFVSFLIETCLFSLASLTFRECWHVVLGSQILILTRHKIKKASKP